jgi:hypothetical protein
MSSVPFLLLFVPLPFVAVVVVLLVVHPITLFCFAGPPDPVSVEPSVRARPSRS